MTAHFPFSSTAKSQRIATPVTTGSAIIPTSTSASIYPDFAMLAFLIGYGWLCVALIGWVLS